jgi:ubiquinone/menaquinone biosynthesis C-methylase UbiE
MMATEKAYKGLPMEGPIATWYAKNTGRDQRRFIAVAETVARRVPAGGRVLEVAPGPGFLAIEVAKAGRHSVTGLDISESFVRIALENARKAGVVVDFRHGNASAMPFPDASFDFVVCTAAFKNFSDPIGALNEIHRVLAPGGEASIYDLRKDASLDEIAAEVRNMRLSAINAFLTRFIFRFGLLKRAYRRDAVEALAALSRFRTGQFEPDGIGFELRLAKPQPAHALTPRTHIAAYGISS